MSLQTYKNIRRNLEQLYLEDSRPWLVGFSGGEEYLMVASLSKGRCTPKNLSHETLRCFGLSGDLERILNDDLFSSNQ